MKLIWIALSLFSVNASALTTHDVCRRSPLIRAHLERVLLRPCFNMTDADLSGISGQVQISTDHSELWANDFDGLINMISLSIAARRPLAVFANAFRGLSLEEVKINTSSSATFQKDAFNGLISHSVFLDGVVADSKFTSAFETGAFAGLSTQIVFLNLWNDDKEDIYNRLSAEYPSLYFSRQN